MDIVFSKETLEYINLVEKETNAKMLNCIDAGEKLFFVVAQGQLGLAIGKNSKNLKRLEEMLKKEIRFVEYNQDKATFVKNIFKPYKVTGVEIKSYGDKTAAFVTVDSADRGKAIGRGGSYIRVAREIAKAHHGIDNLQILQTDTFPPSVTDMMARSAAPVGGEQEPMVPSPGIEIKEEKPKSQS